MIRDTQLALLIFFTLVCILVWPTPANAAACDDPTYTWSCTWLACVIHAESNNQPWVENGSHVGLMQVDSVLHHKLVEQVVGLELSHEAVVIVLKDPAWNIAVGWQLYRVVGSSAWVGVNCG